MDKGIDHYSCDYEDILILGVFNANENNKTINNFVNTYDLETLRKDFTCFKFKNPTCIDLILTNRSSYLQNSGTIETLQLYDNYSIKEWLYFHQIK